MTGAVCLLLAAAVALSGRSGRAAGRRLARLRPARSKPRSPPGVAKHAGVALAAIGAAALVGGVAGLAVGAGTAIGCRHLLRRLEPAAGRRLRGQRTSQLPIMLDLLAICLRAGSPLVIALEVVAAALPGPLATDLTAVAAMQRLGASVESAWARHADDPVLGPVVRSVRRSARSGSALASTFERLAADQRAAALASGQARARRAAVLATAPLGLCFLPAFICLGVVPFVVSVAGTVLH
jgi:Flp pilus assembly protein TadB